MSDCSNLEGDVLKIARIDAVPLILSMMKQTTGMRFAAIARVTTEKWVACAVDDSIDFGLQPGGELVLDTTICNEIRDHRQPVIFRNVKEDPVYSTHHTPRMYQLESYVSIPIVRANGEFFGTLCAIDSQPAEFDENATRKTLELFAQLIAVQLDMQEAQAQIEAALARETETGRLREQFIAVLGHDLRSPLTAISMSAELLQTKLIVGRDRELATSIKQSSGRMSSLIEDVLDFSRGRLGGGIPVRRVMTDQLAYALNAVIDEVASTHQASTMHRELVLPEQSFCDAGRMGQLLSNLLVNAVSHGEPGSPIKIAATVEDNHVILSVTNQGNTIAQELMPLLFHPFTRSEAGGRGEGLGLGLYIASQIAKSHDGTLSVSSTEESGTSFVARFPNQMEKIVAP